MTDIHQTATSTTAICPPTILVLLDLWSCPVSDQTSLQQVFNQVIQAIQGIETFPVTNDTQMWFCGSFPFDMEHCKLKLDLEASGCYVSVSEDADKGFEWLKDSSKSLLTFIGPNLKGMVIVSSNPDAIEYLDHGVENDAATSSEFGRGIICDSSTFEDFTQSGLGFLKAEILASWPCHNEWERSN